jgi:hypothetical protein
VHTTKYSHVEQVAWGKVRPRVEACNAELAGQLDGIVRHVEAGESKGKGRSLPLFAARYPYGHLVVKTGAFLSPCASEGAVLCESCKALERAATYSHIPLTLVLARCAEVYLEYQDRNRTAPLRLLQAGELFGVFETLDVLTEGKSKAPALWNVSSGARSVFVVAPVSNNDLKPPIARALGRNANDIPWQKMKHGNWMLVSEMARFLPSQWNTEVLVFPQGWVRGEDGRPTEFAGSIYKLGWQQSCYLRDFGTREAILSTSRVTRLDDHKTVMHLLAIAKGDVPGFRPVVSSASEAGPFREIQALLANALERKVTNTRGEVRGSTYTPVILQPCHLVRAGEAVYYSFSRPSIPWPMEKGHAHADNGERVWDALREIKEEGYLDLKQTQFFVGGRSSYGALEVAEDGVGGLHFQPTGADGGSGNLKRLPVSDFVPVGHGGPTKVRLSLRSSSGEFFFSASLRVVRK